MSREGGPIGKPWTWVGKPNLSRDVIVVNDLSHQVIWFEWAHIKKQSPDWKTAQNHHITWSCSVSHWVWHMLSTWPLFPKQKHWAKVGLDRRRGRAARARAAVLGGSVFTLYLTRLQLTPVRGYTACDLGTRVLSLETESAQHPRSHAVFKHHCIIKHIQSRNKKWAKHHCVIATHTSTLNIVICQTCLDTCFWALGQAIARTYWVAFDAIWQIIATLKRRQAQQTLNICCARFEHVAPVAGGGDTLQLISGGTTCLTLLV